MTNITRRIASFLTVLALLSLTGLSANAQKLNVKEDQSLSAKTFDEWQTKNTSKNALIEDYLYRGVSISVTKLEDNKISIEATAGASSTYGYLDAIEFTIQPLAIKAEKDGRKALIKVGTPATMMSSALTNRTEEVSSELRVSPKTTMNTPSNTYAVDIKIKGLTNSEGVASVKALVKDTPSTASIGTISSNSLRTSGKCNTNLKDSRFTMTKASYSFSTVSFVKKTLTESRFSCQWWTANCGFPCGTMCAECNNGQPNANCVTCSMGCSGGGTCKGGGGSAPMECGSQV